MPSVIPIHFDASGKPDGYGSKSTYLILPVIGTVIFFSLQQLAKYPHILNYMTKITVENALKQYSIAVKMLRLINLSVIVILSMIVAFSYLTIAGFSKGLGWWFLPVILMLVLAPTFYGLQQSFKKENLS